MTITYTALQGRLRFGDKNESLNGGVLLVTYHKTLHEIVFPANVNILQHINDFTTNTTLYTIRMIAARARTIFSNICNYTGRWYSRIKWHQYSLPLSSTYTIYYAIHTTIGAGHSHAPLILNPINSNNVNNTTRNRTPNNYLYITDFFNNWIINRFPISIQINR